MLLKKQTVWLLTMLSLVVVLSVYYITSPEQKGADLATTDEENKSEVQTESTEGQTENAEEVISGDNAVISSIASDEMFAALRLDQEVERSKLKEDLSIVMGQTDLPTEERSAAKDQLDQLDEIAQKEQMLETLIRAMNYEDVLVRADGKEVLITVKSDKPSPKAANEIIQEVYKEIGQLESVAVEFQVD